MDMPIRSFLQAKIHRATLTNTHVEYEGSVSICPRLLDAAGILPFEQVDVYNLDNGERLTTYAMSGDTNEVKLNGAAAHKGAAGQRVIIAAYCCLNDQEWPLHKPVVVLVDENNKIKEILHK